MWPFLFITLTSFHSFYSIAIAACSPAINITTSRNGNTVLAFLVEFCVISVYTVLPFSALETPFKHTNHNPRVNRSRPRVFLLFHPCYFVQSLHPFILSTPLLPASSYFQRCQRLFFPLDSFHTKTKRT